MSRDGLKLSAGADLVIGKLLRAEHETKRAMRQGWFKVGDKLIKTASKEMQAKNKTGRIYKYKGRKHRASAAGQSAANRSGHLRKSLGYKIKGHTQLEFGAKADYAAFLELGTYKMRPRPTLKNSIDVNEGNTATILQNELRNALT